MKSVKQFAANVRARLRRENDSSQSAQNLNALNSAEPTGLNPRQTFARRVRTTFSQFIHRGEESLPDYGNAAARIPEGSRSRPSSIASLTLTTDCTSGAQEQSLRSLWADFPTPPQPLRETGRANVGLPDDSPSDRSSRASSQPDQTQSTSWTSAFSTSHPSASTGRVDRCPEAWQQVAQHLLAQSAELTRSGESARRALQTLPLVNKNVNAAVAAHRESAEVLGVVTDMHRRLVGPNAFLAMLGRHGEPGTVMGLLPLHREQGLQAMARRLLDLRDDELQQVMPHFRSAVSTLSTERQQSVLRLAIIWNTMQTHLTALLGAADQPGTVLSLPPKVQADLLSNAYEIHSHISPGPVRRMIAEAVDALPQEVADELKQRVAGDLPPTTPAEPGGE